jgi:hypothetical protein
MLSSALKQANCDNVTCSTFLDQHLIQRVSRTCSLRRCVFQAAMTVENVNVTYIGSLHAWTNSAKYLGMNEKFDVSLFAMNFNVRIAEK